jgi:hypothetical protein
LPAAEDTDRLSVTIPQIHRAPDGRIYPQLTHELAGGTDRGAALRRPPSSAPPSNRLPPHFHSLGRSAFQAAALNADKKLDAIARSFDFLLSVTPINTAEAKARFIDEGEKREPNSATGR